MLKTAQVMRITGATRMQMRWLQYKDVAAPSLKSKGGRGNSHSYTFTECVAIKAIKDLRDRGVSLQQIRKLLPELQRLTGRDSNIAALAGARLAVHGQGNIALVRNDREALDLMSKQAGLLLPMESAVQIVVQEIKSARRTDKALREATEELVQSDGWKKLVAYPGFSFSTDYA